MPGMQMAEHAEIAAVMEVDPAQAERLRAKYGARRAYSDEEALVRDAEIDAVYIASPRFLPRAPRCAWRRIAASTSWWKSLWP